MSKIKVSVGPFSLAEGSRGGSVLAFFPPISFFFFLDSCIYWLIWIFIATSRLFTAVFGLSLARASLQSLLLLQSPSSSSSGAWGSVALQPVESYFPDQRSNLCSSTGTEILSHWTTREVPPCSNFWWLPTILGVNSWLIAA